MYPYTASATGLTSRIPQWVQAGGAHAMRTRLKNPSIRRRVLYEMEAGIPYKNSHPSKVMLTDFRLDSLDELYRNKTLEEAAEIHGKSVDETTLDLVVTDKSRVECIYFLQSEENLRRILAMPWVSFGSDAGSFSVNEDASNEEPPVAHPRAFGTFARVLGHYVREERLITLEEAIRRLTSLPADNLKIPQRGRLLEGHFADVVVFDPKRVVDKATFEEPCVYSEGVLHVLVNGVPVLKNGKHTGARPGRIVYGPAWKQGETN